MLLNKQPKKALPSWVLDWTDTPFVAASIPRAKTTEGVPEDPGFQAAGDMKNHEFSVEVSEGRKALIVRGSVMDEIVQVAKPVESLSWGRSIGDITYSDCCFYGALVTWERAAQARSKTPYVTGGYIGLAASGAQKGDRIALVRCGRVPLALRQNSKSDTSDWNFVGDTYIHGIMYGAAFDTSWCGNMSLS